MWFVSHDGHVIVACFLAQNYVQRKARKESDESPSSALALPQVSREERKYRLGQFCNWFVE